jgi:hypothetical protein
MRTIAEIRKDRLEWVREQHGLSLAELSRKLGRSSRDSTLSQIRNGAPDSKTGKSRAMGTNQARAIEDALGLPHGIMDTELPSQGVTVPTATVSIDQALNVLGLALQGMPPAAREAIATNLAGWARDGGADHWRAGLQAMLQHTQRKLPSLAA